jgi:hypothetical protein
MRTRNDPTTGHVARSSSSCARLAASTPALGSSNTAITESPFALHDPAAGIHDRLADHHLVLGERGRHRVGIELPQFRVALDVRKQKRRRRPGEPNVPARTAHPTRLRDADSGIKRRKTKSTGGDTRAPTDSNADGSFGVHVS